MTPAEQRELHAKASTPDEVCALLRARGREREAHYIDSIRAPLSRDPANTIELLRKLAGDEKSESERCVKEWEALTSSGFNKPKLAEDLIRAAENHRKRSEAFKWAAHALTRGMAHGKLELGEQIDEAPCACGGGTGGLHYPDAVGCLAQDGSDEPPAIEGYRNRQR